MHEGLWVASMGQADPVKRNLALTEISLVVAGAIESQQVVSARRCAKLIVERYPDCALSEDEILSEISKLAVQRGLSVESES
jgi:hypothetical protein